MLAQIFKTYDVRATYPDKINETAAWKVGHASGRFLGSQGEGAGNSTMLVSRDMRPHSPDLCEALADGIRASGLNVIDLGMADTPLNYFAINHLDAIGGIQTTASHNPINYNGFKISGAGAVPIGAQSGLVQIQQIAESLDDAAPKIHPPKGSYAQKDLWDAYREHVLGFLVPPVRPIKVVVDASNAMAGKMVPTIFDGVANLQIIPLNFEITGSFVHEPNPLVAANMIPTQEAVKAHGADLGVCFDGDADRCMLTDDQGRIIGCDHLTALLSGYFLAANPGSTIVYDLRSSKVVPQTIQELGGRLRRSRVGHVFMKSILRESGAVFGGELSGHFYFRDNFCADSGAVAFAVVISVVGQSERTVSDLIDPLRKYPQSGEINFHCDNKEGVIADLESRYADDADIDDLDGVTVDAFDRDSGGWWFNVRPSNTEPLLRLNAEAKDRFRLEQLIETLSPLLGERDEGGH